MNDDDDNIYDYYYSIYLKPHGICINVYIFSSNLNLMCRIVASMLLLTFSFQFPISMVEYSMIENYCFYQFFQVLTSIFWYAIVISAIQVADLSASELRKESDIVVL